MADNCTEGHRKKAKYLLDEEELGKFHMIKSLTSHLTRNCHHRGLEAPEVRRQFI